MGTLEENKAIVKRMQKIVFSIMCDVDDFCRENDIRYFLSGGTCLGAVRHRGFIPWDDDGDLMMPRPDYERFLKFFPKSMGEKYGVGSFPTSKEWQRQYARVWDKSTTWKSTNLDDMTMGVFIDIFPIDGLPSGKVVRSLYYMRLKILIALGNACVRKSFLKEEKYRGIKQLAGTILKRYEMRTFTEIMERSAKKYDFRRCKYVGASMAAHYGERETINREFMEDFVLMEFEGRLFPVPVGYKQYLSNLYGDYMTIPKGAEEKGYSHLDHWIVEMEGRSISEEL